MTGIPADALALAFLRTSGFGDDLRTAVHPGDEMFAAQAEYGVPPSHRSLAYYRGGLQAWRSIRHALAAAGKPLDDVRSFLDFACGWGRMLRFAVHGLPHAEVWASDIAAGAVAFVSREFGVHGSVSHTDPAEWQPDRRFDVIYVGSLFSHLSALWFEAWLRRLFELLEPDGLLLFSTHGMRTYAEHADPSGFSYVPRSETTRLDPRDYGSTYVDAHWVRALCSRVGFTAVGVVERELWYFQDLYAATRAPAPGLQTWTHAPIAHGEIVTASLDGHGRARLVGAVQLPRSAGPLQRIELEVEGAGRHEAAWRPAADRSAVPDHLDAYEWHLEGEAEGVRGGAFVTAIATTAAGASTCFDAQRLETL